MALTSAHLKAMAVSWQEVCKDMTNNGVDVYVSFFKAHPKYQDYFKDLKGKTLDDLKTSKKFRIEGARVMHSFSAIMTNFEEMDVATGVMEKLVERHYDYDVKTVAAYEDLFSIMPDYMARHAGATFNDVAKEGWTIALGLLLDVTRKTIHQLEKQEKA